MDDAVDRLFSWLRKRASRSAMCRLRADGLLNAAAGALDLDFVEAREAFRDLRVRQLVEYLPDINGQPYTGYVAVVAPTVPEAASAAAWRECLVAHGADSDLTNALSPAHEWLSELDPEDLKALAEGLIAIVDADQRARADYAFNISARHLLGSSKILDRLPRAARERLGVAYVPSTPRYVVVAGPKDPTAVLLIENATTFELAVTSGLAETQAVVAAYGYGLNMQSDGSAGWGLVESVQRGGCEILARTGSGHDLGRLLSHSRLRFWGDLDAEGLRIAQALRRRIPQLDLSALYRPMLDMLGSRRTSHAYVRSVGKENQLPWAPTGDAVWDALGNACRARAVDQEAVDIEAHRELATHALQIEHIRSTPLPAHGASDGAQPSGRR
jgi:Uncharacterized protein conserved in bacteria C-term(DUF2220)